MTPARPEFRIRQKTFRKNKGLPLALLPSQIKLLSTAPQVEMNRLVLIVGILVLSQ